MSLSKFLASAARSINKIQKFGESSNLFWQGMDDNLRIVSAFCVFIALASFSIIIWSLFAVSQIKEINPYAFIKYLGPVSVLFGWLSWWLIGHRFLAAIRGEYVKCEVCNEPFEGCQTIEEAFRIKGKLGSIAQDSTAVVVCRNGHNNFLDWNKAAGVMISRLEFFKDTASLSADSYKRDKNQEKYDAELEFQKKCSALLNSDDPENYLYKDISTLESFLTRFENRDWPSNKRELLYDLIASSTAYFRLADDAMLLTESSSLQKNISPNKTVQIKRVLLASPSDVKNERDIVKNVIERINQSVGRQCDIRLELVRWEDNAYPGFHEDGANEHVKSIIRVNECHIFIGVLWKIFGTPTGNFLSGTEDEFNLAYNSWKETKSPSIFFYFCEKPLSVKSTEEAEQMCRVLQFKKNFPKEGLWWSYSNDIEFERAIHDHLMKYVLDASNQ